MLKRMHLRQFLAIVETGSFTAAARRINVTQPTLSAGIAELERSVGTTLFSRERRNIRLTDAGNRLLAHARTIEREFRLAEASVSAATPAIGALRLGVLPSLSTRMIAAIASAYAGERPLTLTEAGDGELQRKLSLGQLDAALVLLPAFGAPAESPPKPPEPVLDEGYAMMLPANHRLAARTSLAPAELAGETMIARRSCEILPETSRFFTQAGVRPRFFLRSHNDDRCMAMVRAGLGVTAAPRSLAGEGIIAVPLEGYAFRRRIGLAGSMIPDSFRAAWQAALEA